MADEAVRRGAIDLAQGVMHGAPPPVLLSLLADVAKERRAHIYASPHGVPEYRAALARLLHGEGLRTLSEDNILGTTGSTGGLMAALISQLHPGDGVLLLEPFYPAHEWAIKAARCEPLFITSTTDFSSDWSSLEAQLPRARAVLIGNPSNPSGYVWTEEELRKLFELAEQHNLLLIFDEIYRDYVWGGTYPSPLHLAPDLDRLVVLRGFSKTLAISGWRVGYTVSTPDRIEAMTGVHDALYVGAPSLPQWVLARALREHREELDRFVANAKETYRENRTKIAEIFTSIGMEPHLPQGTFYMLVRHHRADDMAAMRELLDAGVAVAPGAPFFADQSRSSGYIRTHFAVSAETVEEVRKRLKNLGR
jgi:aminotransferase